MWQPGVTLSSTNALPAKYAFLKEIGRRHALNVALIYIVIISLSLATIIVVCMAALRRLGTSTGKDAV